MADGNGSGAIKVDTWELRATANKFETWGKNVLGVVADLDGMTTEPGDFQEGQILKGIIDERLKSLDSNVTTQGNWLQDIADLLRKLATDYDKTDDDNAHETERIDTIQEVIGGDGGD